MGVCVYGSVCFFTMNVQSTRTDKRCIYRGTLRHRGVLYFNARVRYIIRLYK